MTLNEGSKKYGFVLMNFNKEKVKRWKVEQVW